jgi:hypothetical protein
MPHQTCSVCRHEQREAIDQALEIGSPSLRTLAGQFGLSKTALDRHHHHLDYKKDRENTGQIAAIDSEITRLRRAQKRAKKKRDSTLALKISSELRGWISLRTKVAALNGVQRVHQSTAMTSAEAVALAKAVIETNLSDAEVIAWLRDLLARVCAGEAGNVPEAQQ